MTTETDIEYLKDKEDRHVVLQIDDVHQTIEFIFNTEEKENG